MKKILISFFFLVFYQYILFYDKMCKYILFTLETLEIVHWYVNVNKLLNSEIYLNWITLITDNCVLLIKVI